MTFKEFITVVKATWREFGRDDVGNMAAALTYYSFFSLFPLLILAVSLVSFWLGDVEARTLIFDTALDIAVADELSPAEVPLLRWLEETWGISYGAT